MRETRRAAPRTPDTQTDALTAAQARELLCALRRHPASYEPPRKAASERLAKLGLFERASKGGYRLSEGGLDAAARLQAQAIIDQANATKLARRAAAGHSDGATEPPPDWPFPISAHRWD